MPATTKKRHIDSDWQTLWACCQIQPLTPREMRVWLDNLDKLRAQLGQLQLLQPKNRRTGTNTHHPDSNGLINN